MKHRFAVVVAICACAVLVLVSTAQMMAQEPTDQVRYSGTIKELNMEAKTFTLETPKTANIQVKFTDQTKYTYRNQPSTVAELKQGRRAIVMMDPAQKKEMVALRIDIRDK